MYWRMYSGRNCVNYAAYRMVDAGLPDVRPWSGSGNATNWGRAMSSITDKTPVVGSIAWWKGGAPGASSLGHVAYVEKVVSSSEIIISESNYGSDFDWRRLTKPTNWPTGFIHFSDAAIVNLVKPTISGTPQVGQTLTVGNGKWKPVSNAAIQWYADGKAIANQTHRSITPTKGLLGKRLSAKVTASLTHYESSSVTTAQTAPVAAGNLKLVASPTITGTPQVGGTLTVGSAKYSPPVHVGAIRWYADGKPIPGATGRTITLSEALVGKQITAAVVGTREAWNPLTSKAAAVGPVVWPQLTPASSGKISGTPSYGRVLKVSTGGFKASGVKTYYQWYRGSSPIKGATKASYKTTADDLGKTIRVRVHAKAPKFRDYIATYAAPGRIQATPTIRIGVNGHHRAEQIRIRILGPGGYLPRQTVSVMTHSVIKKVRLVKGFATVKFNNVPAGKRRVRVTFTGDAALVPRVKEVTTRVYKH